MLRHYCLECDWHVAEEVDKRERSKRAVRHHLETGHAITSTAASEAPTDGENDALPELLFDEG